MKAIIIDVPEKKERKKCEDTPTSPHPQAIFAFYCSIQLQEIDKQKLRELASQARADSAKRAQKTTEQFPSADGVSFGAPVKVR